MRAAEQWEVIRASLPDGWEEVRLAFVVEDRCRDVVAGHPDIDRVFVFPRRRWQSDFFRPWRWA